MSIKFFFKKNYPQVSFDHHEFQGYFFRNMQQMNVVLELNQRNVGEKTKRSTKISSLVTSYGEKKVTNRIGKAAAPTDV